MQSLAKAESIVAELLARNPGHSRAQRLRAEFGCYGSRIDVSHARDHARRCVEALEPLAAGRPTTDPLTLRLGEAHILLAETGEVAHAAHAMSFFTPLVDDRHLGRRARLSVSLAQRLIGWAALEAGDPAAALTAGESALRAIAPIIAAEGESFSLEPAFTLQLIGRSRLALSAVREGVASLEHALRLARRAYEDEPANAFNQDRLVYSMAELAMAHERFDRSIAADTYRDAVALLPSLTLPIASPHRDWARGVLYEGHARLNVTADPCSLLVQARAHFEATRGAPLPARIQPFSSRTNEALATTCQAR
jgi:hypothetical protein